MNDFHYQTDGWLSADSADVYETSTETLFLGRQDAMQRATLLPLAGKMKKRCREIAEERFTYAAMVQRCVDVYGTVLGEETAPKQE